MKTQVNQKLRFHSVDVVKGRLQIQFFHTWTLCVIKIDGIISYGKMSVILDFGIKTWQCRTDVNIGSLFFSGKI
jgi:hypothetical protein